MPHERESINTPPPVMDPLEAQRIRLAIPSWEEVDGSFRLRAYNSPLRRGFYETHRETVKRYYNAQVDIASGKGTGKLDDFLLTTDRLDIRLLRGDFKIIKQILHLERKKPTHGWAKHVRREKSVARRGQNYS